MPADNLKQEPDPSGEDDFESLRPTHVLKNIKAGDSSVQLLVSTKDHLYDADSVEAGLGSLQVIGAWDESALPELSKCIGTHQRTSTQARSSTQSAGFATRFGDGYKLGDP